MWASGVAAAGLVPNWGGEPTAPICVNTTDGCVNLGGMPLPIKCDVNCDTAITLVDLISQLRHIVSIITLVEDKVGYFPDAPTERGRKHLTELLKIKKDGHHAAVVFIVQRDDAQSVRPNDTADHKFGETIRDVVRQGVEVYAYKCRVDSQEIFIDQLIPVQLTSH